MWFVGLTRVDALATYMIVLLTRTVRVEIRPDAQQASSLLALVPLVTAAYNDAAAYAFEHPEVKGAVRLHHAVYRRLRAQYGLPSQFVCNVQRLAMGSVAALRKRKADDKTASCPHAERLPIPYDARTMSLRSDRRSVTFTTLDGRIEVRVRKHQRLAHYATWTADSGKITCGKDGRFWLSLTFTREVAVAPTTPDSPVVGCDRGIVIPAALSNGRFVGDPKHHPTDRRYFRTQRSLQRKGTKSAKRRLKRREGKWSRFRDWADHNVTTEVLQSLAPGTVLALEDLTNIRTRGRRFRRDTRRRMHAWSFRRQQEMLEYKAPERGVSVVYVDARYTSQRCSACGHTAKDNRRSQARFKCRTCGYAENADLNAARNIAANWTTSQRTGGPPVASRKGHVSPPNATDADTTARRLVGQAKVSRVANQGVSSGGSETKPLPSGRGRLLVRLLQSERHLRYLPALFTHLIEQGVALGQRRLGRDVGKHRERCW